MISLDVNIESGVLSRRLMNVMRVDSRGVFWSVSIVMVNEIIGKSMN